MGDVFASVFIAHFKCAGCQTEFQLLCKRRKCRVCSELQAEKIFCKRCSLKFGHPLFGSLKAKRYCKPCYLSNSAEPTPTPPFSPEQERTLSDLGFSSKEVNDHPKELHGLLTFFTEGPQSLPTTQTVGFRQFSKQIGALELIRESPYQHYEKVKKVGEGGSGSVYVVRRLSDGTD